MGAYSFYDPQPSNGTSTITNCTIISNSVPGDGGGIYSTQALTITRCTFSGNTSGRTGGGLYINHQNTTTSITKSTFVSNNATTRGGAISHGANSTGNNLIVNFCRITGNTAGSQPGIAVEGGVASLENNWWGCNLGPSNTPCDQSAVFGTGSIDYDPWLQLKSSASPTTICGGATSTITTGFLSNSSSTAISSSNLTAFIGVPVSFVSPVLGTLSGAQATIQANGTATVTYTAGGTAGTGSVNAVVDNVPNTDALAKASMSISKPAVSNPGVTTGTVGTAFSQTFTQSGGTAPVTFSTTSTLPTGLNLSSAGVLSGTPTQSGSFPIVVNAQDNLGCTAAGSTYTLVISCQTITVTNPGVTTGTNGTAFSQTFTQSGALGGAAFSTTSSLPTGLILSTAGVLSGTPNATPNTYPIVVKVTDGNGCFANGSTYNLVISNRVSANSDYFRSITSGNWNAPATWESATNAAFTTGLVSPATLAPDFNANTITIRNPDTVTVTANLTTDQTVINSGGKMIINPNIVLIVNDGTGTDLTVDAGGTMKIRSTSAGTGSIGNSTTATISGNVTVERYISSQNNRAYRLLGPSVTTSTSILANWQEGSNNFGTNQVFITTLSGAAESPSNPSAGTGSATITIDNTLSTMRVQCNFSGLTGTVTAAHIHAPTAVAGTGTAGVATTTPTFAGFPSGVTSGTYDVTLDMTQASSYNSAYITANGGTTASAFTALKTALNNGTSYFNIHSSAYGGGEIRGFLNNAYNPAPGYGTQITGSQTGANGFDATTTGQGSLFTYDPGTDTWIAAPNTNVATLKAKTGYLIYIRGDRSLDLNASTPQSSNTTLRATGNVLTGQQQYTALPFPDTFTLVTNPYASALNWNLVYNHAGSGNAGFFTNYYTYWDPNIGSRGGYVTVTDGGTVNPAASGTVNIPSGLAFFVRTNSISSSAILTIQESDKSSTNNIDVFRPSAAAQKFAVSLYYSDAEHGRRLADGVTALYDDSYNAALDGNDAIEINNWDENIAIARAGKHLSIEERPIITTTDTLALFMNNMKQQGYEFEFKPTTLVKIS